MRDRRLISLLVFVLVIVTVSFILVSFWGYRYYFQKKEGQPTVITAAKPIAGTNASFSDSLQHLLNSATAQIHETSDSAFIDSASDSSLAAKLVQFDRLREEIAGMLHNRDVSKNSMEENEKISELQQNLEALKARNDQVAAENERLSAIVKQLMDKKPTEPTAARKHSARSGSSLPVLVAHLRFVGMSVSDNKGITNIAAKTERLYGSFEINIKPTNTDHTIYIAIIQPNGKTLMNGPARSGSFQTESGKKPFTTAITFDNQRDNGNRLVFTVDSHNFQRGTYAMQVYHQGLLIGRLTRTLY